MTASQEPAISRIEDEAANWLVVLAEDPEDEELLASFEAWRRSSDLHASVWQRTARAYDLVGRGAPAFPEHWRPHAESRRAGGPVDGPVDGADDGIVPFEAGRSTGRRRTPSIGRVARIGAAAVAAAAAVLVAAILLDGRALPDADYATATAETREIRLDDGSTIHLAPQSAIDVAMTAQTRRLTLIAGEAFFDVARDPTRPFVVRSGDTTTAVLGTAFDVERIDEATTVAVRRGRVLVTGAKTAAGQRLSAGDRITMDRLGGVRTTGRPDEAGSWMRGELVVHDRPVREVVASLRRYFRGVIVVRDRDFAERRVSGLYDLDEPTRTLTDLASAHGATVWRLSPWVLLVTPQ